MSPNGFDVDAGPQAHGRPSEVMRADPHMMRARRTASTTRTVLGALGILLASSQPSIALSGRIELTIGFSAIVATALVQLVAPKLSWAQFEESIAGVAAVMILGLGDERITIFVVLWLAAVASGVLARGGRVHWIGRTVVLGALALPIVRHGEITSDYAGFTIAAIGLLMTSGRLTRELNRLLVQARHDADHDDLTGLLSRSAFRSAVERAAASARRGSSVSLLLLDLDDFGKVNKRLGHSAGDSVLAAVGRALLERAGPGCQVGRLGGDEFAVLAPGVEPLTLAQTLLDGIASCAADATGIAACVGVAQAPSDGDDGESLLMAVEIALRIAKRTSGERVASYAGESLSGDGRLSARYALTKLIAGDGLSMAVQPIVDLHSGRVHAYEALARFGGARQSPVHWLSVSEELGQRANLERACLREALALLPSLPAGTRLSVNLSATVLLEAPTLALLDGASDLSEVIVEVTEHALVDSDSELAAAFAPLRERGATLAVDDVGAGYSGLRQVTVVHPRYLKLDRSLVSGIDGDRDRAALVSALVDYAERVGSLLIAEGIESDAELETLLELGVPLGQGYLFSRPEAPWPLREAVQTPLVPLPLSASRDQRVSERRSGDRRVGDRRTAGELVAEAPQPPSWSASS
ncbi:MAG: EAL domain-containing protein [Solirubrobacteraceae bacterium]